MSADTNVPADIQAWAPPVPQDVLDRVAEVGALRRRLSELGYRPVAVRTGTKRPDDFKWQVLAQRGHYATAPVGTAALSTGIAASGLRAVDIDVDDENLVAAIMGHAMMILGSPGVVRFRADSPRLLLLYRAIEKQLRKRMLKGEKGKIEILGHGQQFMAFGQHPDGAHYEWDAELPERDNLPTVSEDQITAFSR